MKHIQISLVVPAALLGFLLLYALTFVFRRYLAYRHIPGPLLAKWTDLWLHEKFNVSRIDWQTIALDLDHKYGPVAMYGPNRVTFSSPAAVNTIYGTTNVLPKAPSYDVATVLMNGTLIRTFATFRDEHFVTKLKRQLTPAFAAAAVSDYEHHIDETIIKLVEVLNMNMPATDLHQWLNFFTFDTISRIAFSDTSDLLKHKQDVDSHLKGGRERFEYWHKWFALPTFERLVMKHPWVQKSVKPSALGQMAAARIQERQTKGASGPKSDLLDRYLRLLEIDSATFKPSMMTGLTLSTIHAGSETTGNTLAWLFWDLFCNPGVYSQLKKEIREANLSSPPKLSQVKKLSLLEASIKESQRLHQLLTDPIEREIPAGGATIEGVYLPAGTVVCANAHALAVNRDIYGMDATSYNPYRWLEATHEEQALMERCTFAFSQGKRNCIGKHIAWAEMLKVVPELLNRFDIELADHSYRPVVTKSLITVIENTLPVTIQAREI